MQQNNQHKTRIDFLVYSPPKCGTTALSLMLQKSPHIIGPKDVLEPHFFNNKDTISDQDIINYNNLFEYPENSEQPILFFEKSTTYFNIPNSLDNIRRFCKPELKFITCLRNPVERFISRYIHFRSVTNIVQNNRTQYMDKISSDAGWRRGWERSKANLNKQFHIDEIFNKDNHVCQWALLTGCYINSLNRLYDHIDQSNILIINYHQFKQKNHIYINAICDFLDIPHIQTKNIYTNTTRQWVERSEKSGLHDVRQDITEKHMNFLYDFYYDCNEQLDQFLPKYDFNFNHYRA